MVASCDVIMHACSVMHSNCEGRMQMFSEHLVLKDSDCRQHGAAWHLNVDCIYKSQQQTAVYKQQLRVHMLTTSC